MQTTYNRFDAKRTADTFDRDCDIFLPSAIPADLRKWIAAPDLARIVADAVRRAERAHVLPEYAPRWELLLAWSAYAHVTGRFSSEEIAAGLRSGETAHHALSFADANVIRQFRRLNRPVLEHTLAEIIRAAHELRGSDPMHARWNHAPTAADFHSEAKARIQSGIERDWNGSDY